MKDNTFQQLVDREFALLEWTDQQRMDTLRQMNKEDRPVMKRNFYVALLVALLVLSLTSTAVAAGLNITTIKEFFDRSAAFLKVYGYEPSVFDETSVVNPKCYRHTSELVNVTVDQIYLTDEALYFTVHFSAKSPDTLLFDTYHSSILLNGEEKRYYHLWDTDLALLHVGNMTLDDLNGLDSLDHFDSIDASRDPETGTVTFMYAFKHQNKLRLVRSIEERTLMLRFQVRNLRNNNIEWNALFIDLPRMTVVNATPSVD